MSRAGKHIPGQIRHASTKHATAQFDPEKREGSARLELEQSEEGEAGVWLWKEESLRQLISSGV